MIGKYIKNLRTLKGLTLEQLAEKLNKSYPHIHAIENGRSQPRDETIMEMLIKGFDIPYSEAQNMIAQWRVEDALEKAADPSKVINNIVAGNHSIVITGDGNNISK